MLLKSCLLCLVLCASSSLSHDDASFDLLVRRDVFLEQFLRQSWADVLSPLLRAPASRFEPLSLLGMQADPLWMWPIEQHLRESGVFEADFSACDVHMHNMRSLSLDWVRAWRPMDQRSSSNATDEQRPRVSDVTVAAKFSAPILWMSGYYKLRRSFAFAFVPVKNRQGDFNVDVKDVSVSVSFTLPPMDREFGGGDGDVSSPSFRIQDLDVRVAWGGVVVKFERIAGRFSTIADLFLNQLGFSVAIVEGQKSKFLSELRPYSEALLNCMLNHPVSPPAEGVQPCMRRWWATQGWEWPWEYPPCVKE